MPFSLTSRLFAWLEVCRISNLPTVWTNVLVGSAIAAGFGRRIVGDGGEPVAFKFAIDWKQAGAMLVAMSLFYIAGMVLNDIADAEVDARERPGRPIPSGRVGRSAALAFVYVCFLAGMIAVIQYKPQAMPLTLLLLIAILAYDLLHKRFAASVLIMGLCRALVVLASATGQHTTEMPEMAWTDPLGPLAPRNILPIDVYLHGQEAHFHNIGLAMALTLGAYVVCITIIARGEMDGRIGLRKWLAPLMPVAPLLIVALVRPDDWRAAAAIAFVLSMWLARPIRFVFATPPRTIPAILAWLSGICLVDAYFLALLGVPLLAAIAIGCFILTAMGHWKILGT